MQNPLNLLAEEKCLIIFLNVLNLLEKTTLVFSSNETSSGRFCLGLYRRHCDELIQIIFKLNFILLGEFDPGSERTLVAGLIHASRTRKPFGVSKVAKG